MYCETQGSWQVLKAALGRLRTFISRSIGCSADTIDLWCNPKPTREAPNARGRSNPIDIVLALIKHAEDPKLIEQFLADSLGVFFVPKTKLFGFLIEKMQDPEFRKSLQEEQLRTAKQKG